MSEEHRFETTLVYPADPAQKLPPDPDFSRDNRLRAAGHPEMPGALPRPWGATTAATAPRT